MAFKLGDLKLTKLLDEYLVNSNRLKVEKEQNYYPSEASVQYIDDNNETKTLGKCLRAAYFRCNGFEASTYTARTEKIFALGKYTELMLIENFKRMGIWRGDAIKWKNLEYNISGELDLVVEDMNNSSLVGVEIKSIHGYNAEREVFGNSKVTPGPKANHLLQTLIYTWQFRHDIDYFKILYIMRDNGKTTEFDVSLSTDLDENDNQIHIPMVNGKPILQYTVEDILNRYKQLDTAVKTNTPPPTDYQLKWGKDKIESMYTKKEISKSKYEKWKKCKLKSNNDWPGDWQCSYCPYKDLCWTKSGEPKDIIIPEKKMFLEDILE